MAPGRSGSKTPTTSLWKYERNPDYFKKDLPYLDEIEIHLITDPQAMVAALLSKRIYWSDVFPPPIWTATWRHPLSSRTPISSTLPTLVWSSPTSPCRAKSALDDLRVRQALSEAVRRDAISELGNQAGAVGTGVYPLGPWAMPRRCGPN